MNTLFGQRSIIYKGSSKIIYSGMGDNTLTVCFLKNNEFAESRNKISAAIWYYLRAIGIDNHFVQTLSIREQLIKSANVYPVFIRLHNISGADLESRLGIQSGTIFASPMIEWRLTSKHLRNNIVSRDEIEYFQWGNREELYKIQNIALRTNDILRTLFLSMALRPATIDLQFGLIDDDIVLVNEISPDTILFWNECELRFLDMGESCQKLISISVTNFKIY